MRYVIVDPEGATRARFGRLREVQEWAAALKERDADLLDELILLTYDAAGDEVANQWLTDFVPDVPAPAIASLAATELAVVRFSDAAGLSVGLSEMASSMTLASHHPRTPASGSRSRGREELAVG